MKHFSLKHSADFLPISKRGQLSLVSSLTSLDQFKGMNQIGNTGRRDQVNNHYLKIFGASLAVGATGGIRVEDPEDPTVQLDVTRKGSSFG